MDKKIKIIIADDVEETRKLVKTLLSFDDRIDVIGEACNGKEAIDLSVSLKPDIVLMDINMPVIDGLKATESISIKAPKVVVIIMSVQKEQEYLRKAMLSGAKEYIIKPFDLNTSVNTIIEAYNKEQERKKYISINTSDKQQKKEAKIVSFFSTKGGSGKTTIAVNTAISIAKQTGKKVALLDLDLQFGDVSAMLDINPKNSLDNLIEEISNLDREILDEYMINYNSIFKVLCAPKKPEYAEYINSTHIENILKILKEEYDYIVIDTPTNFSDTTLVALDNSDYIYLVTTMDLLSIKNVKLGFEVMDSLNYSDDKVKLVINKANQNYGIKYKDLVEVFEKDVNITIPEDNKTIINSINKGYPFMRHRKINKIYKSIKNLASIIIEAKK